MNVRVHTITAYCSMAIWTEIKSLSSVISQHRSNMSLCTALQPALCYVSCIICTSTICVISVRCCMHGRTVECVWLFLRLRADAWRGKFFVLDTEWVCAVCICVTNFVFGENPVRVLSERSTFYRNKFCVFFFHEVIF